MAYFSRVAANKQLAKACKLQGWNLARRHVAAPTLCRAMSTQQVATSSMPAASSFLHANGAYVDEMYQCWRVDPNSVHKSWDAYFRTGAYTAPPSLVTDGISVSSGPVSNRPLGATPFSTSSAKILALVRAFQVRGHLIANIDPLGIMPPRPDHEDLKLEHYGFTEADLDREVDVAHIGEFLNMKGFLDTNMGKVTLRKIYQRLVETYCGSIGYEYMHIPSIEKCNWLREKIETRDLVVFSKEAKLQLLDRLTWADHFENFLKVKWSSAKRFGLEGAESFIAAMKSVIGKSGEMGVENIVIGMPHRGRLNVLNTVVRKNLAQIFSEFNDQHDDDPEAASGDVKYHLGMSYSFTSEKTNKIINLSLMANPSHLEAVDPVVLGKVRAKQFYSGDVNREKVMSILVHGDAAFSGQGVVYECFGLSNLKDYCTGGTVHVVVNNQVGFTTDPVNSRSTPYCTDLAKMLNAPIFHVNGDDPEAVVHVAELASEWRQRYKGDVVIDLVCFRKNGHNEIDEPNFTQPLMYQKIAQHPSTLQLYQKRLLSEGISESEIKAVSDSVNKVLNEAFEQSKTWKDDQGDPFTGTWQGLKSHKQYSPPQPTGVEEDTLVNLGKALTRLPEGFKPHSRLAGILKAKEKTLQEKKGLDFGTCEALAFGSLLLENKHVRLSGQDVQRGTFSHRHALIHDQNTNATFVPLNNIAPNKQAHLSICNSSLSEYAVLGFELGYSLENPHALVLWEAQFGDFANTAQVIIDQFLSSGEDKWLRQCGLVMLLPHGYEGQGPEHSSGRMERFLQGCSDHPDSIPDQDKSTQIQKSNWQIVNCSTPANYFHVLRRQLCREFRKPLIIFTPKSLLRQDATKPNTSSFAEMAAGTSFQKTLPDHFANQLVEPSQVKRVIFCSGKVAFDLMQRRNEVQANNIAVIRVEQLSPFPFHEVASYINLYNNAEIVWSQEEPMNMGAYTYVKDRIIAAANQLCNRNIGKVRYIGRRPAAATAEGHLSTHKVKLEAFLKEAVTLQ